MNKYFFLFVTIVIVFLAWFFTPYLVGKLYSSSSEQGQFGDIFGSINALFSGLAFVGLVFTIILQRDDLKLQSEELRLTRGEIHEQKIQMSIQN